MTRVDVLLAESAMVADGRLFVLGGAWDRLVPDALPMVAGRIGIALVVHLPPGDGVRLQVRLLGPDGEAVSVLDGEQERPLLGLEAAIDAGADTAGLDERTVPLAVNLDNVLVTAAGAHAVVVSVDGEECGRASFAVVAP